MAHPECWGRTRQNVDYHFALIPLHFTFTFLPKHRSIRAQLELMWQIYKTLGTYLKLGTGNPCAWHNKPKLEPYVWTNEKTLLATEKDGAFVPTGSRNNKTKSVQCDQTITRLYLKDGTGNPWAGHIREKVACSLAMKPRILSRVARVENVGLALPTGSDEEKFDWKTFSVILTCTWETGTPEQDRAVWKSAPPEYRRPTVLW